MGFWKDLHAKNDAKAPAKISTALRHESPERAQPRSQHIIFTLDFYTGLADEMLH